MYVQSTIDGLPDRVVSISRPRTPAKLARVYHLVLRNLLKQHAPDWGSK